MQHTKTKEGKGARTNQDILAPEVRLVDETGALRGVVPTPEALQRAKDVGLDLVEVAPDSKPPVCKILDYGKVRFEARKKKAAMKKKQKTLEIKELQFRVGIEDHDYQVKKRHAQRFLSAGNKVRVVLRFKGREMGHQEIGVSLLQRLVDDLADFGKLEAEAKTEGRRMLMVLLPLDAKDIQKREAQKAQREKDAALAKAKEAAGDAEGEGETKANATPDKAEAKES